EVPFQKGFSTVVHNLIKALGKSCDKYSFLPKIKSSEPLPKKLEYDSCLIMNQLDKYYFCIPRPLEIQAEN
ncbi:6416_t:CDS:1, partial [Funneliformis geosporum]